MHTGNHTGPTGQFLTAAKKYRLYEKIEEGIMMGKVISKSSWKAECKKAMRLAGTLARLSNINQYRPMRASRVTLGPKLRSRFRIGSM